MKVKQKLIKRKRVFDDDKIATLDSETDKRTNMVARLLGGSKEAREIQSKFAQMVEVPDEDFDIKNFKELNKELKLRVQRPALIYEKQQWMNKKHQKNISAIEDFIDVLPTSAESA